MFIREAERALIPWLIPQTHSGTEAGLLSCLARAQLLEPSVVASQGLCEQEAGAGSQK